MALVDYDSSGESSDGENEKDCEAPVGEYKDAQVTDDKNEGNLFATLPKPKEHVSLDGKDQFKNLLLKGIKIEGGNKREPAKISVPSLNDFDDDDDDDGGGSRIPKPKKMKTSASNAGLFAVLPPPKNVFVKEANRQLIPHVVKNQLTKPKMKVSSATYNTQTGENSNFAYFNASDSADFVDQETPTSSYFGEGIANTSQNLMNEFDSNTSYTPTGLENDALSRHLPDEEGTVNLPESYDRGLLTDGGPNAECNDWQSISQALELDEKALHILCGGKRKRNQMPVNIIDLSGEEIMPDSKEWLLKQLSEENIRKPNQKKSNGPSVQSRRKHQITYLAYQAKAQELELQNQWSNNRMSRRQTQSKYGF